MILLDCESPTRRGRNTVTILHMSTRYLSFAVFASGMTTLAVEFTASRLLGNVFGTSNIVWASIIGLILIYLTAGYFIGGRWADRSPFPSTFYKILLWAAFASGLAALAARPVLRVAADAFDQLQIAVLAGSFVSVLILFVVPVTLLGMVSPFAIRLAISKPEEAGQVSGRLYAISTLGSFVGTFLPVLVFIPLVGSTYTFMIFSFFLMFVALAGLGLVQGRRATGALVVDAHPAGHPRGAVGGRGVQGHGQPNLRNRVGL